MSANTAPDATPSVAAPAQTPAPADDALISDMEARRKALAVDIDELAARLVPDNLTKMAKLKAREKVEDLRSQARSRAA